jgi:hypothetical protein
MAATDLKVSDGELPVGTQDESLNTPYAEDEMRRVAGKLESGNPLWIVVYGVYSRQFIGFPRFSVPTGTMAVALHPGALEGRMRGIERRYGPRPIRARRQRLLTCDRMGTGHHE